MGVKDLWQLLLPIGRRVSIETLEGKTLAIDASIWITQFIKAMRDEEGHVVKNAHLIGTLRRILKLLFNRIRPVFVFDGATPQLKLKTTQARRVIRDRQEGNLKKAAERILLAQLKQQAIRQKLGADGRVSQGNNSDLTQTKPQTPQTQFAESFSVPPSRHRKPDMSVKAPLESSTILVASNVTKADCQSTPDLACANNHVAPSTVPMLRVREDVRVGSSVRVMRENGDIAEGHVTEISELGGGSDRVIVTVTFSDEDSEDIQYPSESLELIPTAAASTAPSPNKYELRPRVKVKTHIFRKGSGVGGNMERVHRPNPCMGDGGVERETSIGAKPSRLRKINHEDVEVGLKSASSVRARHSIDLDAVGFSDSLMEMETGTEGNEDDVLWENGYSELPLAKDLSDSDDDGEELRFSIPENTDDIDIAALAALPPHMRKEIVEDARRRERQLKRQRYMPVAADPQLFSQTQLANFLRSSKLNKRIDEARVYVEAEAGGRRIAAESSRSFVLERPSATQSITKFTNPPGAGTGPGNSCRRVVLDESSSESDEENLRWIRECRADEEEEEKAKLRLLSQTEQVVTGTFAAVDDVDSDIQIEESWVDSGGFISVDDDCPSSEISDKANSVLVADSIDSSFNLDVCQWSCWRCTLCNPPSVQVCEACGALQDQHWRQGEDATRTLPETKMDEHDIEDEVSRRNLRDGDGAGAEDEDKGYEDVAWESGGDEEREGHDDFDERSLPDDGFRGESSDTWGCTYTEAVVPSSDVSSGRSVDRNSEVLVRAVTTASRMADWAGRAVQRAVREHFGGNRAVAVEDQAVRASQVTRSSADTPVDVDSDSISSPSDVHVLHNGRKRLASSVFSDDDEHDNQLDIEQRCEKNKNISSNKTDDSKNNQTVTFPDLKTESSVSRQTIPVADTEPCQVVNSAVVVDSVRTPSLQTMLEEAAVEEDVARRRHRALRSSEAMTEELAAEVRELLTLLGLPYLVAPFEAEAQCAVLEELGLVDGVVTEDSDAFLFGAHTVYRNIFDDKKYVEVYLAEDARLEMGVSRAEMVALGYLLGSDYTEGVKGVGVVNAVEILNTFEMKCASGVGEDGLLKPEDSILAGLGRFRDWLNSFDVESAFGSAAKPARTKSRRSKSDDVDTDHSGDENDEIGDNKDKDHSEIGGNMEFQDVANKRELSYDEKLEEFQRRHRGVRCRWSIPDSFPDPRVAVEYLYPKADRSGNSFTWDMVPFRSAPVSAGDAGVGEGRLGELRLFCANKLGWPDEEFEAKVLPVLRRFADSSMTQRRIDSYFSTYHDQIRFARIQSSRLKKAVVAISGGERVRLEGTEKATAKTNTGPRAKASLTEASDPVASTISIHDNDISLQTQDSNNEKPVRKGRSRARRKP